MPRICVVMCTFQGERYLPEQLESIARQRRPPDAMVIVDDASTDATVRIARDFAASMHFPIEVHVNPRNLGFARNFERAISLAEGDVLVLSGQDDVWMEDRLGRTARALRRAPDAAFLFGDAVLVDERLRPLPGRLSDAVGFGPAAREGAVFETLVRGNVVTGATMAVRARHLPLLLPFPEGVEHDAWMALVLAAVAPAIYLDEPLIRYRQHANNQIGARQMGVIDRAHRARRDRTAGIAAHAARNHAALERLARRPLAAGRRELLRRSAEHLARRAALPPSRLRRLAPIAREYARGGYHLSRGAASALRDLVA